MKRRRLKITPYRTGPKWKISWITLSEIFQMGCWIVSLLSSPGNGNSMSLWGGTPADTFRVRWFLNFMHERLRRHDREMLLNLANDEMVVAHSVGTAPRLRHDKMMRRFQRVG
ncbi:MAG: hypothetical protein ACOY90_10310 [Candidatus Zhuqueibacterota bacterium]